MEVVVIQHCYPTCSWGWHYIWSAAGFALIMLARESSPLITLMSLIRWSFFVTPRSSRKTSSLQFERMLPVTHSDANFALYCERSIASSKISTWRRGKHKAEGMEGLVKGTWLNNHIVFRTNQPALQWAFLIHPCSCLLKPTSVDPRSKEQISHAAHPLWPIC